MINMAAYSTGGRPEEVKTQFLTREGCYNLLQSSDYSKPKGTAFGPQASGPVNVSFVAVRDAEPSSASDRLCVSVGKELYFYVYRGVHKSNSPISPIDKRLYKGTTPTCHDCNEFTASTQSCSLLVGFSAGQVQLLDPMGRELSKLFNEERTVDKTRVTCVKWVPASKNYFLASHASGCMYAYNADLANCGSPGVNGAPPPSYQTVQAGDGYTVQICRNVSSVPIRSPSSVGSSSVVNPRVNPLYKWTVGEGAVNSFRFSPCARYLAVVGQDGCMRVFEYSTMRLVGMMRSYFGGLHCIAWSPDGRFIATGGEDDLVTLYSFDEHRVVCRGRGHHSWVMSVAFDPFLYCDQATEVRNEEPQRLHQLQPVDSPVCSCSSIKKACGTEAAHAASSCDVDCGCDTRGLIKGSSLGAGSATLLTATHRAPRSRIDCEDAFADEPPVLNCVNDASLSLIATTALGGSSSCTADETLNSKVGELSLDSADPTVRASETSAGQTCHGSPCSRDEATTSPLLDIAHSTASAHAIGSSATDSVRPLQCDVNNASSVACEDVERRSRESCRRRMPPFPRTSSDVSRYSLHAGCLSADRRPRATYRLGSVGQDTQLCLWDLTEDVLQRNSNVRGCRANSGSATGGQTFDADQTEAGMSGDAKRSTATLSAAVGSKHGSSNIVHPSAAVSSNSDTMSSTTSHSFMRQLLLHASHNPQHSIQSTHSAPGGLMSLRMLTNKYATLPSEAGRRPKTTASAQRAASGSVSSKKEHKRNLSLIAGRHDRHQSAKASSSSLRSVHKGSNNVGGNAAGQCCPLGSPQCPRLSDVPIVEPHTCKKVASEMLSCVHFLRDCIVTASHDGIVSTWVRPERPSMPQTHAINSPASNGDASTECAGHDTSKRHPHEFKHHFSRTLPSSTQLCNGESVAALST